MIDVNVHLAAARNAPMVEIAALGKSYVIGENRIDALIEITFSVVETSMLALMGPSGSGKSTLLNIIGALDKPTDGVVTVRGTNLSKLDRNQQADFRNETIGFVFQNFNLVPVLTTLENVLLPAQLGRKGFDPKKIDRAKDLLQQVGLEKQTHQSVNRLSGGQMQRVSIARALINQPKVILADEPTANLDHKTADSVLRLLKELSKQQGSVVIIATHDLEVLKFCDRVITLHDGRLFRDELNQQAVGSGIPQPY